MRKLGWYWSERPRSFFSGHGVSTQNTAAPVGMKAPRSCTEHPVLMVLLLYLCAKKSQSFNTSTAVEYTSSALTKKLQSFTTAVQYTSAAFRRVRAVRAETTPG